MPQSSPSEADIFIQQVLVPARALQVKVQVIADWAQRVLDEPPLLEMKNLSLIVQPKPCLILPKKRKPLDLLCAPKLVLDAVTRYLSWEEKTWKQKVIEETEREITNPVVGWQVWETQGDIGAFTAKLANALQLPQEYLGFPAKPPALSGDKNSGG